MMIHMYVLRMMMMVVVLLFVPILVVVPTFLLTLEGFCFVHMKCATFPLARRLDLAMWLVESGLLGHRHRARCRACFRARWKMHLPY